MRNPPLPNVAPVMPQPRPAVVQPNVVPKAVNAPNLINFTGVPEGMGGNQYYGRGISEIDQARDQLAQAALGDMGLSQVKEPFGGAAYMVNRLSNNMREGMAASAEAATREQLGAIMGGIDPATGPTMDQVRAAYEADPAFGEKLYAQLIASQNREQWEPYGDGLQRNTVTGEIKKTGAAEEGGGAWKPTDIGGLRDDYVKAAGAYDQASPSWQLMRRAAARAIGTTDSPGKGADDYAMVIALAKILDPTSVVREGEVETIRQTGGAADYLTGYINQLKSEGSLSDEVRRSLMRVGQDKMRAFYDQVKSRRDSVVGIAERHGVDPRDVVYDLGDFETWEEQQQPDPNNPNPDQPAPAGGDPIDPPLLPNGDVDESKLKPGQRYIFDGDNVGEWTGTGWKPVRVVTPNG